MFVDIVPNRSSPPAILLRESYREDGRVKKRTVINLSGIITVEEAIKFKQVLKGADIAPTSFEDSLEITSTSPHGHVAAVLGVIIQLKLPALLGKFDTPERRNAMVLGDGKIIRFGKPALPL